MSEKDPARRDATRGETSDPDGHALEAALRDDLEDAARRGARDALQEGPPQTDGGHEMAPASVRLNTSRMATVAFGVGVLAFGVGTAFAADMYTGAMGLGAAATAAGLGFREVLA